MLAFKRFILESGDSYHPYDKVKAHTEPWADESHRYQFKDDSGNIKHVDIHHQSFGLHPNAYVSFHDSHKEDSGSEKHSATGELRHKAVRVFSTVKHILKHHAQNHPHLSGFEFSSSHDEPSRVKLYSHMAKKLGGKTEHNRDISYHYVDADKLK